MFKNRRSVTPASKTDPMPTQLTDRDKAILTLAARNYHHESNRERAVWDELHLNMNQFWQQVRTLVLSEAALAHDPLATNRLRRRLTRPVVRTQQPARFVAGWNRSA